MFYETSHCSFGQCNVSRLIVMNMNVLLPKETKTTILLMTTTTTAPPDTTDASETHLPREYRTVIHMENTK